MTDHSGPGDVLCETDVVDLLGDRAEQQDAYGIATMPDGSMVVALADGMGGHAGGRVASRLAIETFIGCCHEDADFAENAGAVFERALEAANASLRANQSAETAGMGTTLVGLRLSEAGLAWISVGDSPLWLWRSGALMRLNEDHSLREIVGARAGGKGNALCSALTGEPIALVDHRPAPIDLQADDIVVLASDGILTLDEDALTRLLDDYAQASVRDIADVMTASIVSAAKPGQDNTTIILSRINRDTPSSAGPVGASPTKTLTGPILAAVASALVSAVAVIALMPRR